MLPKVTELRLRSRLVLGIVRISHREIRLAYPSQYRIYQYGCVFHDAVEGLKLYPLPEVESDG